MSAWGPDSLNVAIHGYIGSRDRKHTAPRLLGQDTAVAEWLLCCACAGCCNRRWAHCSGLTCVQVRALLLLFTGVVWLCVVRPFRRWRFGGLVLKVCWLARCGYLPVYEQVLRTDLGGTLTRPLIHVLPATSDEAPRLYDSVRAATFGHVYTRSCHYKSSLVFYHS